ncbi:MAG: SDR family NAD(P)-dependent oxidoreductase [Actinomycetia bacterium]|nr:SDR family NAD(P)-dependent oxidoreductase [Actinomycetes bacterium]
MQNAFGNPQQVLLLGGTSDIGLAIVHAFDRSALRRVVLACREVAKGEAKAQELRSDSLQVDVVEFHAEAVASTQAAIDAIADSVGDIDVAIVAFAQLGDSTVTTTDAAAAAALAVVDFGAAVAATVAVGNRMRAQGHGSIVVLSSVAGERVRMANPVYGGAKAGLDGFAQGYGDAIAADGVHVMIVRPGFVHSQMTTGKDAAPFATTPDAVAKIVVAGLRSRRRMVWAPKILRPVFSALRHVPGPLWRRLPLS